MEAFFRNIYVDCLYYEGRLFPDRKPKKCIQPCPVAISTRVAAKNPIIAKRPFQISALGLNPQRHFEAAEK